MTREEWKAHCVASVPRDANCLYCGKLTGRSSSYKPILTVCCDCRYSDTRDESREVAAGMRPWSRPLPPYSTSAKATLMGDRDWADAAEAWNQEQADIKKFNTEAMGYGGS